MPEYLLRGERRCCSSDCGRLSGVLLPLIAWAGLLGVDLLTKLGGFARLHGFVRLFPTVLPRPRSIERAHRICGAVDRAAIYYFKRAWCLQRSALAVCLLRIAGYPAQLTIGAHRVPFYAHAWAELGEDVVNDDPAVRTFYRVLERC